MEYICKKELPNYNLVIGKSYSTFNDGLDPKIIFPTDRGKFKNTDTYLQYITDDQLKEYFTIANDE